MSAFCLSQAWGASNGRVNGERRPVPLIVETLILCAIAFLLGFGAMAWLMTRRTRNSFLD